MGKLIDLTGQRFGRLTVIERAEDYVSPKGKRHPRWLCHCDCGNTVSVYGEFLRDGRIKSCGCLMREIAAEKHKTHGLRKTRLYNIWSLMRRRCTDPHSKDFARYGGRGITVCNEWLHSFQAFYDWSQKNGYRANLSIDRIDNDKGYSPHNCRWASKETQGRNKSTNLYITIGDEIKPLSEWCIKYGVPYSTAYARLSRGWTSEEALGIVPKNK